MRPEALDLAGVVPGWRSDVGEIFKDPRKRAFLNPEGADRPLVSPLSAEVLERARGWRKRRLLDQLISADVAGILLYDPINIRYATDVSNMQVWATHNPFHYALVFTGGHTIDFQYRGAEHLSMAHGTVDEARSGIVWFYGMAGDQTAENARLWAAEVADLVLIHGHGSRRLAVDKLEPLGTRALEALGIELVEGQALAEAARVIKSPDEIALMRWTICVAEAGMARMHELSEPGRSEQEIWAEFHHENARSGGEWIETRLCTIGRRTNPWFQECSGHVGESGEMLAFDTDMIGPYGYCADLSRSWTIGHVPMTNRQHDLYALALEQIRHNTALLAPGLDFETFNERSWRLPERFLANRYSCAVHGVGLADEWPLVPTHVDFARAHGGRFEAGMTVCVESYLGEPGGPDGVKLETQVWIGETGVERLDSFPFELD
jgi:Xaa-Pro dipeptidase